MGVICFLHGKWIYYNKFKGATDERDRRWMWKFLESDNIMMAVLTILLEAIYVGYALYTYWGQMGRDYFNSEFGTYVD